jgi:hypothetical protein
MLGDDGESLGLGDGDGDGLGDGDRDGLGDGVPDPVGVGVPPPGLSVLTCGDADWVGSAAGAGGAKAGDVAEVIRRGCRRLSVDDGESTFVGRSGRPVDVLGDPRINPPRPFASAK